MAYKIKLSRNAERTLGALDRLTQQRIAKAIENLGEKPTPRGCIPLSGCEGMYRIRVGDYRIVYSIEVEILRVYVIRIGHRREVYRNLLG
jgi:mRNA interferase RelE/StbE